MSEGQPKKNSLSKKVVAGGVAAVAAASLAYGVARGNNDQVKGHEASSSAPATAPDSTPETAKPNANKLEVGQKISFYPKKVLIETESKSIHTGPDTTAGTVKLEQEEFEIENPRIVTASDGGTWFEFISADGINLYAPISDTSLNFDIKDKATGEPISTDMVKKDFLYGTVSQVTDSGVTATYQGFIADDVVGDVKAPIGALLPIEPNN